MTGRVLDLRPKLDARAARPPRRGLRDRAGLAVFAARLAVDMWRSHWRRR